MKFLDRNDPSTFGRLKAYEKAGYLMIDPRKVRYLQPDFRAPDEIDLGGGPKPLSLALIVRRVGREHELTISGAEVLGIAEALYQMYGATFRQRDMAPLIASLQRYPAPDEVIDLLPPTTDLRAHEDRGLRNSVADESRTCASTTIPVLPRPSAIT